MKTILKIILIFLILISSLTVTIIYSFFVKYSIKLKELNKDRDEYMQFIDRVNYKSEWDTAEEHRISYLAESQYSFTENDVTLVTQCSFQNIYHIMRLVEHWQGPMSVSVFSRPSDVLKVLSLIARYRHCYPDIALYVTFHLVTYEGSGNLKYERPFQWECSLLNKLDTNLLNSQNYNLSIPYPVNLMRNVAKRGIKTNYFFLIDIDMIPSNNMRQDFVDLLRNSKLPPKSVFIIPAFELSENEKVPKSKSLANLLVQKKIMRPFYAELCSKCHSCVDYQAWHNIPKSTGISVAYLTTWTDPCEPFYISTVDVPQYDESFKQYGFNRISQVCELHYAGYSFYVLDNAFLVHIGLKTEDKFHTSKQIEQETNRKRFREFKQTLRFKYPLSLRHC